SNAGISVDRSIRLSSTMKVEARVALVIGNQDYSSLNVLKNPINDATAMRDILKEKNFSVIYLEDASQMEMESAIESFANRLSVGKGVGLFYYAGHGIEVGGVNYLIPTDARIPSKKFVKSKSVSTDIVVSAMEEAKNRLNIVILDSCRSNPFGRDGSGGLAPLNSASGIYVAYATAPGRIAEDGDEGNGLFTKYLIRYINQSGLKIEDVFKRVRENVMRDSNNAQVPWSSSSIYGDFYFTLPNKKKNSTKSLTDQDNGLYTTPSFKTNPTDVTIDIGGVEWYERMRFKRGTYMVTLSKSGYVTKKFKINFKNDNTISLKIDKEPFQEPEMVKIEKGSFHMGSRSVDIDYDFEIGKYEVSVGEFRKFINETNYKTDAQKGDGCYIDKSGNGDWGYKDDTNWENPNFPQTDSQPVVCVSWNDAKAYTRWLSKKISKHYRLPTEAEWEFVARAGTKSKWSFGDSKKYLLDYANIADNSTDISWRENWNDGYRYTAPTGSFRANQWGVHDMYGNVWEWCEDWYLESYSSPKTNVDRKVFRGGSWHNDSEYTHSSNRHKGYPTGRDYNSGFRVVRTL
ncbi:SUMF1/EgtB/PvdO family nonheme iron enzyme, partial [Sulfurovum sp. bin170]|uniref:SUMF1/EgtB/PvdO family nonheme iron enzyme n=1 Tax=Sulfurovum sp. bin170 TaxID=2695268 RepID=UPI0013DF5C2B